MYYTFEGKATIFGSTVVQSKDDILLILSHSKHPRVGSSIPLINYQLIMRASVYIHQYGVFLFRVKITWFYHFSIERGAIIGFDS